MADSVGNLLGPRSDKNYIDDEGRVFKCLLDDSVSAAVGNIAANPASPRLFTSKGIPFKPRIIGVALDSDPTITKEIVIGDPANALYASSTPTPVVINTVAFTTTYRRGEQLDF